MRATLKELYWLEAVKATNSNDLDQREGSHEGLPSVSECINEIVKQIDLEIARLEQFAARQASLEETRNELNRLRANVPHSLAAEHLLRYAAELDRARNRAQSELARLQEMRLGQRGAPTVRLKLEE